MYVTDVAASVPAPVRSPAGFARVALKPGERRRVNFTLAPEQLAVVGERGRRVVEPGEFTVSVGGRQPGFAGRADAATTGVVNGRFVVTGEVTEVPWRVRRRPPSLGGRRGQAALRRQRPPRVGARRGTRFESRSL